MSPAYYVAYIVRIIISLSVIMYIELTWFSSGGCKECVPMVERN